MTNLCPASGDRNHVIARRSGRWKYLAYGIVLIVSALSMALLALKR